MAIDYKQIWENAGGKVPSDWEFVSIDSLLSHSKAISVGVMYPGTHSENGIPLIRVSDVKDGKIIKKPDFLISHEVHNEYKRTELDGSELLITLVGNPGDCVIATTEMSGWNAARALAVLKLKDIDLRAWLRYILLSQPAKHLIDSRLNTTVQKTLNLKDIKELGVPIAPESERKKIINIVNSLDDKIELNRQMNATLEAMAQALFKSWFVDFDPVIDNALAAGNPIPDELEAKAAAHLALGEARKALPPEIQALFPKAFVLSEEMGWIPEGWEVGSLQDFTTKIGSGATPRGGNQVYQNTGVALIRSQNVYDSEFIWNGLARITDEAALQLKNVTVQAEDILMNITGASILRTCVVSPEVLPARVNQHVVIIRAKEDIASRYLHLNLLQNSSKEYLMRLNAGGSREAVTKAHIESVPIIMPNNELLEKFHKLVTPKYKKINQLNSEVTTLSILRDTLLPKLLSGELRISE